MATGILARTQGEPDYACTGQRGIEDARNLMAAVANCLGLKSTEVFPLSTGVIGVRMPIERMLEISARSR